MDREAEYLGADVSRLVGLVVQLYRQSLQHPIDGEKRGEGCAKTLSQICKRCSAEQRHIRLAGWHLGVF